MKTPRILGSPAYLIAFFFCVALGAPVARAQTPDPSFVGTLKVTNGVVEVSPNGRDWITTAEVKLRPGYRIRTGANSRAMILWTDNSTVTLNMHSEVEINPPHVAGAQSGLQLLRGLLSFFHREKPGRIRAITRGTAASIHGTEFVMAYDPQTDRTTMWVIDGEVRLTNAQGFVVLTNNEQAIVESGAEPKKVTAGFIANNLLQWAFYYPAVLDVRELPLSADEQTALAASLGAYRQADLLAALANYPQGRTPQSESERIYHAALLLSVGQAEQSESELNALPANRTERTTQLAAALRQLIAAVKREASTPATSGPLATEMLAASYYEQSRALGDETLKRALNLARAAATNSPEVGFAWTRVAELEFSFGRTAAALEALNKSLALTPRNAQALALKGFLLAAQNKPAEAADWFGRALAVDSALGNAWLGQGLVKIRRGDLRGGQQDLLIAASIEPRRAGLRSYLGKAFAELNDPIRALHELDLAKQLDPNDPTAWLYSALVKAEGNRINEAIRDLEQAQELNQNRSLYRSSVLVDQDGAVKNINLARMYADSDLGDVALREAGRAVTVDYANYSAHLFLANSYEVERRANLGNFRYETAAVGEYLLANLLGPPYGRLLAQPVTQLEYSQLFERNRLGIMANTEYFSHGAWRHSSAQYGTYNASSYSLEAEYRSDDGERKNQDLEFRQLEAKFKHDVTPDGSVFLSIVDTRAEGGDVDQQFDERSVAKDFRFKEKQTPTLIAGYRHQWSPKNHTLLLAGRFEDILETSNPADVVLALDRGSGMLNGLAPVLARNTYRNRTELYLVEAQQIATAGRHSFIAGARGQWTEQEVDDRVEDRSGFYLTLLGTNDPVSVQHERASYSSVSLYAYDYIRLLDSLHVVGGLNYTRQSIPVNARTAPLNLEHERQDALSPKAAIIWSPIEPMSVRGSYSRSLAGESFGQSLRLEPVHVAGMLQSYRNPAPRSIVGELDGARIETSELIWEGRFDRTYLSLGGQSVVAERNRKLGLYLSDESYDPPPTLGLIRERVRFREHALQFSGHQLVSREWSFGLRYRLSHAELKRSFPEYPGLGLGGVDDRTDWRGRLHTLNLSALYRNANGVFARVEGVYFTQERERDEATVPSDSFWQVNVVAGYRFPKQRAEVAMGVLNVLDCDYRLDSINRYADQPRSRTFYAGLLISF